MAKVTKLDCVTVAETANMSHETWLQMRFEAIGGSEAATVAGVNKYNSPYRMYLEKRKLIEPRTVGEAAEWGNILEPVIRKHFAKVINEQRAEQGLPPLRVQQRRAILAHKEHNFMRTNLDGLVLGHEKGTGILEIKTAGMMLASDWEGEDIPDAYYLQVQHNLMVTGLTFAFVAVLIGGNTYKQYFIERDEETINFLMQIEHNWWYNHFLAGIPPEIDGHDATKEALREQYPNSYENREGEVIHLPNVASKHAIAVEEAKAAIKSLEEYKQKHENELKLMIGDQETVWADKHKITWKTDKNGVKKLRINLEATEQLENIRNSFAKCVQKRIKDIEKQTAGIEKEVAQARKLFDKQKKENDKALKAAEKEASKMLKEAIKQLKKTKDCEYVAPEYIVIDKAMLNGSNIMQDVKGEIN